MPQRVQRRARSLVAALAAVVVGVAALAAAPAPPAGAQPPPDSGASSASASNASGGAGGSGDPNDAGIPRGSDAPASTPGDAAEALIDPEASVSWGSCADGDVAPAAGVAYQCGRVQVPLHHEQPDGPTLSLALVRLPAGDPVMREGSLLVNPGGPGGSGVELALSIAPLFDAQVRARYDIVGFDPRGVGASGGLACGIGDELLAPEPSAARRRRAVPPTPSRRTPAADELLPAQVAYGERIERACEQEAPGQLAALGTAAAAHDLELLREAVGDRDLNYLGYSYGSTLGATYAELYPDRVGRFVLDGATAPNDTYLEWVSAQMVSFERVLERFLATCAATPNCQLQRAVPATSPPDARAPAGEPTTGRAASGEPAELWRDLLARAETTGLATGGGPALDRAGLVEATMSLLYLGEEYHGLLATLLHNAATGDAAGLAELAERSSGISAAAYYGVVCADDPSRPDPGAVQRRMEGLAAEAPTFARDLREVLTCSALRDTGRARPVVSVEADETPPLLVVATTNDPATPYAGAVAMADALRSAVLVTYEGDGHTVVLRGNRCIDAVVTRYLVEGHVPAAGTRCRPTQGLGVVLSAPGPAGVGGPAGAVVAALTPDSPATGVLEVGDVVRTVNGAAIRSPLQLDEAAAAGTELVLDIERDGRDLTVRLRARPPGYGVG